MIIAVALERRACGEIGAAERDVHAENQLVDHDSVVEVAVPRAGCYPEVERRVCRLPVAVRRRQADEMRAGEQRERRKNDLRTGAERTLAVRLPEQAVFAQLAILTIFGVADQHDGLGGLQLCLVRRRGDPGVRCLARDSEWERVGHRGTETVTGQHAQQSALPASPPVGVDSEGAGVHVERNRHPRSAAVRAVEDGEAERVAIFVLRRPRERGVAVLQPASGGRNFDLGCMRAGIPLGQDCLAVQQHDALRILQHRQQ